MTRVLIGILSNEAARYAEFWACMMRLETPAGSVKDVAIGTDYVSNQNILAQRCLDEGFDFLWLMGDDHSFAPDLLEKLLVSAQAYDLPILVPLCSARRAPFALVDYGRNPDPDGPDYLPVSLTDIPAEGIVELDAAGSAGMLIRRDVLEAIDYPWFLNSDRSEDILFCEVAVGAGFKIHADVACRLGHILTAVVTPGHDGENWVTGLVMGDLQLAVGTAEQLLADQSDPRNHDDNPHPDELPEDQMASGSIPVSAEVGQEVAEYLHEVISSPAERIEVWVDEELRWWWRAIDHDGNILVKDSGVNEATVLGAAEAAYPGVMAYMVDSERHDSRNIRQYHAPSRMPSG
jgi:hypothetical protein